MAIDKSMTENFQAQMLNMLPQNNPFLVFHIRRNYLVQDTLRHIENVRNGIKMRSDEEARWEFMKPLKVSCFSLNYDITGHAAQGEVHDLRMDGGLSPGFQKATVF